MKKSFLVLSVLICTSGVAQSIFMIDFVKIKDNKKAEALYFYEHNWKVYRARAVKKNFIKSYQLITVTQGVPSYNYDLLLVTEFADSAQYKLSEEHFQSIITSTRPNGPLLLNKLKPEDFSIIVDSKTGGYFFKKVRVKRE